jgi:hypothetical protein
MNWDNLLTQFPIVGVFVWFVLEMDRRNAKYAAQRDSQWREFFVQQAKINDVAMERIADMLDRVSQRLDAHDTAMRQAMAKIEGAVKVARKSEQ